MKKFKTYIILFILLIIFTLIFKYNTLVKSCIIESSLLWFNSLVPFMSPMYLMVDLFNYYGIQKIFKNSSLFITLISLSLGCPSSAKYISEFYSKGYLSLDDSNYLLLFAYSPNPLFIIGITPSIKDALIILSYIYITNLILMFTFKNILP